MAITIRVNRNDLPQVGSRLNEAIGDAITAFVNDVVAFADPETPVDTGTLKNRKTIETEGLSGKVHWEADYALFVHEGTRSMPARPFATNAFEKATPALMDRLKSLEEEIA